MATFPPEVSHAPRRTRRPLRQAANSVVIVVLVLVLAAGAWIYWRVHVCMPQLDGTVRIQGLQGPVEVLRDARGVPHIEANSREDLMFAQGYVTAQDRLWQMDLSRRIAEGRLSEIFGPRTLSTDVGNRTLGLEQAAERGVEDLDPEERKLLHDYAQGINAFISSHQNSLPIEFLLLHYHPEPWRESDSLDIALNMTKLLNTSWQDDLMRERVRSKLNNAQLYSDVFPSSSPLDHPVADVTPNTHTPARASQPHPAMLQPRLLDFPPGAKSFSGYKLADLDPMLEALELPNSYTGAGSNNWVISGAHTRSGKPLLANDPHLPYGVPSVWYMVHLKAHGLDVSGVSLPGLPMVIIGHNQHIAWGMTNTGPDVQDLYAETFNPKNLHEYLYNGKWVEDTERTETIKVRGKPDEVLQVKSTRHGPIISNSDKRSLALAWTALLPHALQFPFFKIDEAQNWKEFTDALRDFSGPMQNFVYADTEGNIGFYAAGWVPIRKHGDGSIPVPGSNDDYEWTGMIPFEDLPHAFNPQNGIIATANSRIVPDKYPYFITAMWGPPYRTARIYQLLSAGNSFTVADMLKIQMDIHPLDDEWLRQRLIAAAKEYPPTPDAQFAIDKLRAWDGEARADSTATLLCEATKDALLHRILEPRLGKNLSGYFSPMSTVFLQNVIDNNVGRWLPPGDQDFNQTLMKSLEQALKEIQKTSGTDKHEAWKWGDTIPLTFRHPLGGASRLLGSLLNVGPYPQSGTSSTIRRATRGVGPSMRMVVDLGDLDRSVQNITLGESGQVFSPYYKDQFEAWYHGWSFPMLFSDKSVQKGVVHRLALEPAGVRPAGTRETEK